MIIVCRFSWQQISESQKIGIKMDLSVLFWITNDRLMKMKQLLDKKTLIVKYVVVKNSTEYIKSKTFSNLFLVTKLFLSNWWKRNKKETIKKKK